MSSQEQPKGYINASGTLKSTILCCISSTKNQDVMNLKKNQGSSNEKLQKSDKNNDEDKDLAVVVQDLSKEIIVESISELNSDTVK